MIFQIPHLGPPEDAVLELIRELWSDLRYSLVHRPTQWTGMLARSLRAKAIQGSNSIEGYVVSQEAALAALDGDKPEETDATSWVNVVHYREAMDYVLQTVQDEQFTYSPQLLKALHFMMMRHRPDKHPGLWRPGAIYVRNETTGETVYEAPPSDDVPSLTQELCQGLARDDTEVRTRMVRAAMAHLNLVMIHPFSDGNGRMARCLQTLVLARGGVLAPTFSSIEEYLGRNTQDYYSILAAVGRGSWNPQRSALPWVRFCLTAHYRQASSVKRRLDRVAAIADEVERQLRLHGLPERAAISLVNALLGYKIRNESYRREADVSQASATRDLRQLTEAGVVLAVGEKRGRHYAPAEPLIALAAPYAKGPPIADPFTLV